MDKREFLDNSGNCSTIVVSANLVPRTFPSLNVKWGSILVVERFFIIVVWRLLSCG